MIIKSSSRNIVESHDFKSEIATIEASEMRYISSLLRNNYSDTILATVRETWANAVDANNTAKSLTPIKINFPTSLDYTYSVRDFGFGLSEEELFGLYTKYGRSTKRNDNLSIGGFGIGRFAPLSYADSFTVTSFKNGEKIVISVYVDEVGDTRFTKLAEESTTEPNGVEISVAVKQQDIGNFLVAGDKVLVHATAPYKVSGLTVTSVDWIIKNDSWGVVMAESVYGRVLNSYSNRAVKIVMGGIAYPLDMDILSDKLSHIPIFNSLKLHHGAKLFVMFAPVGTLSLHHSREQLEYNESTKKNLINFFEKLQLDVRSVLQKEVNDIQDVEKFMEKMLNLTDNYVLQQIATEMPFVFNAANGDKVELTPYKAHVIDSTYTVNKNNNFTARNLKANDKAQLHPVRFYAQAEISTAILIADNKKNLFAKAKWIQNNLGKQGYTRGFSVYVLTPEQAKEFLTSYTSCNRIFLSSTTQEFKADKAETKEGIIVWKQYSYNTRPFIQKIALPQTKFYYVNLKTIDRNNTFTILGKSFGRGNCGELFRDAINLEILDKQYITSDDSCVYGVFDDSKLGENAINVETLISDYVKKELKNQKDFIVEDNDHNYRINKFKNRNAINNITNQLKNDHLLFLFLNPSGKKFDYDKRQKNQSVLNFLNYFRSEFENNDVKSIDKDKIDAQFEVLIKKYPIIYHIFCTSYSYYIDENAYPPFLEYISLIDKNQN
jgi:hypothetical protein